MPCLSSSSTSYRQRLIPILRKLCLGLLINFGVLLRLRELFPRRFLPLIVCSSFDLSPLLQSGQELSLIYRTHDVQGNRKATNLATTSWYFQPTSWLNLPTVQYFLPGFNLNTLNACGTTILFFLSYGGGTPSKTLSRSIAAAPRAVL